MYVRDDLAADMDTVISFSNGVIETLGLYSKTNKSRLANSDTVPPPHSQANLYAKPSTMQETLIAFI